jgi:acyl-CoA reductase-like NAD-dependent aldehyde dehydrogenase
MSCWVNGNQCPYGFENFVSARIDWCKKCQNITHEGIDDYIYLLSSEVGKIEIKNLSKAVDFLLDYSEEFAEWLKEERVELERYLSGEEKTTMGYEVIEDKLEKIEFAIESL